MAALGQRIADWVGDGARIIAALLLPIAVVLSHRNIPIVLSVLAVGGAWSLRYHRPTPTMWWLYGLIAYAIASVSWSSYDQASSWYLNLILIGLVSTGMMLSFGPRTNAVLMWGMVAAVLLIGFEAITGGVLRDIIPPEGRPDKDDVASGRGVTIMLGALPGLLFWLWRCGARKLFWGVLALMAWASLSFTITANALALAAGLSAGLLAYWRPRFVLASLPVGTALLFLIVPLMVMALPPSETLQTLTAGPVSWRYRLIIWKEVWDAVLADGGQVLWGHGVEGARALGEAQPMVTVPGYGEPLPAVSTHPHNVVLQFWYELGAIGIVLALGAMRSARRQLRSVAQDRELAAAIAMLWGSVVVFASVDANLWTVWRISGPLLGIWAINCAPRQKVT